jgi:hypothetical protein
MKSAKIFIVFIFLLLFVVCVSAQSNQYPNEIEGYEFFKDGKLNDLKILASDRETVKAIFGEKCDNGCDYNEDWKISFSYVSSGWCKIFTENGKEQTYKPKPEFVGKLAGISFHPKRQILLSVSTLIPKEIRCRIGTATGNNLRYRSRTCVNDKRIIYAISDETSADAKVFKGQIMSIGYLPSEKKDDEIYALVEK